MARERQRRECDGDGTPVASISTRRHCGTVYLSITQLSFATSSPPRTRTRSSFPSPPLLSFPSVSGVLPRCQVRYWIVDRGPGLEGGHVG
eukprot:scaffold78461_cov30-Tisochrysis_lutea.AAC.3